MALRLLLAASFVLGLPRLDAAGPDPAATTAAVDAALVRDSVQAKRTDDTTFLRRVSLDLTGKLPEPDTLRTFAADTAPDKRAKVVDAMLGSEAYAVNWGRYWRDTVT